MLSWLRGKSAPAKSREVLEAEKCFDATTELPAIRKAFKEALIHAHSPAEVHGVASKLPPGAPNTLSKTAFVEGLCHLHGLNAVLADALFCAVSQGCQAIGVSEDQVILAKVCLTGV